MVWYLFVIFVVMIIVCIIKLLLMMVVMLIGIVVVMLMGVFMMDEVVIGFGNLMVWMVVMCMFMVVGFIKLGFGKWIVYLFVSLFGKCMLSLVYVLFFVDVVLVIGIFSNNVWVNGIMYFIIDNFFCEMGFDLKQGIQ